MDRRSFIARIAALGGVAVYPNFLRGSLFNPPPTQLSQSDATEYLIKLQTGIETLLNAKSKIRQKPSLIYRPLSGQLPMHERKGRTCFVYSVSQKNWLDEITDGQYVIFPTGEIAHINELSYNLAKDVRLFSQHFINEENKIYQFLLNGSFGKRQFISIFRDQMCCLSSDHPDHKHQSCVFYEAAYAVDCS